MDVLNDDCVRLIFGYLALKDQIAISKTCRRFQQLCQVLWLPKFLELKWTFKNPSALENFAYFIQFICDSVQSLELRFLTLNSFEVLKSFKFPCTTSLSFTQCAGLNDETILEMTKIFPNLQHLSPHGHFSGAYINNWQKLKILNLNYCSFIKFENLEAIFEQLELISIKLDIFQICENVFSIKAFENFCKIENIFLNTCELFWMQDLKKFEKLKEVTVADNGRHHALDLFIHNLFKDKCDKVTELESNFIIPNFNKFNCLRRLLIFGIIFTAEMAENIAVTFSLREVILKSVEIEAESNILYILNNCKQLEYLSLEDCLCGFTTLHLDMRNVKRNKTDPMLFNFFGNVTCGPELEAQNVTLRISGNSSLIKITSTKSTGFTYDPFRVVFS